MLLANQESAHEKTFVELDSRLKNEIALRITLEAFSSAEAERAAAESRWRTNELLYRAYVPPRNWPGTSVPRASLGKHIVFEQVEGALPLIQQALFSNPEFFSIEAEIGADPQAARAQQAHLEYALEKGALEQGSSVICEYMKAIKQALIYGNGAVLIEYDPVHALPRIREIDIRNVYVDPLCPSPSIDRARYVVIRNIFTVEEIRNMRADERMMIPSDGELRHIAGKYSPSLLGKEIAVKDDSPDPRHLNVEVLAYYSPTDVFWVLNRVWVMYNAKNIYGIIPLAVMPCYTVPGRFYGLSIADIQEGNQRYSEALINNRLDQVHLQLFPPRAVPHGFLFNAGQNKWAPGIAFQLPDPKAFQLLAMPDVTSGIHQELAMIQVNADRATGLNPMAISGIPMPSNANRSASGVQAQISGSNARLFTLVYNAEHYLIVSSITKAIKIIRTHAAHGSALPGIIRNKDNPQEYSYVRINGSAFWSESRVLIRAAMRMINRDRQMQAFQILMQALNGPLIGSLADIGIMVDPMEMVSMLVDSMGIDKRYRVIRPMNEQERQAYVQSKQAQEGARAPVELEKAQIQAQARLEMGRMKAETERMTEQMRSETKRAEIESKRNDPIAAQIKGLEAEIKRLELMIKQQEARRKELEYMKEASFG
ncbi:MAG: portal protein [bacterium JZ-2024 1]